MTKLVGRIKVHMRYKTITPDGSRLFLARPVPSNYDDGYQEIPHGVDLKSASGRAIGPDIEFLVNNPDVEILAGARYYIDIIELD